MKIKIFLGLLLSCLLSVSFQGPLSAKSRDSFTKRLWRFIKNGTRSKKEKTQEEAYEHTIDTHNEIRVRKEKRVLDPTPIHHELTSIIESVENAVREGPEFYSEIVNTSVETVLNSTQKFLGNLIWGTQSSFITSLQDQYAKNLGKASLLLQIKITESYIDTRVPLLHFIRDITIEEIELDRYEKALLEIAANEWMQQHEHLATKIADMTHDIQEKKHSIKKLRLLTTELLSYLFEPLIPPTVEQQQTRGFHIPAEGLESESTINHYNEQRENADNAMFNLLGLSLLLHEQKNTKHH